MSKSFKIAALHGGGPAPGSATVFEGVVSRATELGIEVMGVPYGFSDLRKGDSSKARLLTLKDVSGLREQGGTFLQTHRASLHGNPELATSAVKALVELGASGLVVVGGEDSGSSAYLIERAARESGQQFGVAHVAKTIDGDIYHPEELSTFGVDTAAREAARDLVAMRNELSSTPGRCFLVGIMGRSSGELARKAAEVAAQQGAKPALTLVPELFPAQVPMEVIRNVMTGALLKSRKSGIPGAIILCSEGVLECCTEESVMHLLKDVPVDDHGHIQHSKIQFAYHMARLMEEFHARIGLRDGTGKPFPVTSIDIGYGRLRCSPPSDFDREYTLACGKAAVDFLKGGKSGATAFYRPDGKVHWYPFSESVDSERKRMRTRPMSVDAYRGLILKDRPFLVTDDLHDPALISQTNLSPYGFKVRFAPTVVATEHV